MSHKTPRDEAAFEALLDATSRDEAVAALDGLAEVHHGDAPALRLALLDATNAPSGWVDEAVRLLTADDAVMTGPSPLAAAVTLGY